MTTASRAYLWSSYIHIIQFVTPAYMPSFSGADHGRLKQGVSAKHLRAHNTGTLIPETPWAYTELVMDYGLCKQNSSHCNGDMKPSVTVVIPKRVSRLLYFHRMPIYECYSLQLVKFGRGANLATVLRVVHAKKQKSPSLVWIMESWREQTTKPHN